VNRLKLCLLVAAGYWAGSWAAFVLFSASDPGPVLFPPAGVTAAALILTERRLWPYVLATAGLSELAIDTVQGIALAPTLWFVGANVIEPLVGVSALRLWHKGPVDLTVRRDSVAYFGAAVVLGPMIGGAVGALGIAAGGGSFLTAYLPFWAGDALGVLTVGGTILAWTSAPRSLHRRSWVEVVTVLTAIGALTAIAFTPTVVPLSYLAVPLLFFSAFRYGIRVVMAGGLLMTLVANLMTVNGYGPWHALAATPRYEVATLQLFLAVVIVGAWVLTIAVTDRERQRTRAVSEEAANRRLRSLQLLTQRLAIASAPSDVASVAADHAGSRICDTAEVVIVGDDVPTIWRADDDSAREVHRNDSQFIDLMLGVTQGHDAPMQRSVFPRGADASRPQRVLVVPLETSAGVRGALACAWSDGRPVSDQAQAEILSMAQMVGEALVRAQLYEEQRGMAHRLQEALLPKIPSSIGSVTAAAMYLPADPQFDVGGDWYDVFMLERGRVGFAVGDVMGHDLQAAATMGKLSATLRLIAPSAKDPADVLGQLDEQVADIDGAFMCSLGFGDFDPSTRVLRYARAGHLPPVISDELGVRVMTGDVGPPLGLAETVRTYDEHELAVSAVLVCFTDGLIERRGEQITAGLDRLVAHSESLRSRDPRTWCLSLRRSLVGDEALEDDAVILALSFGATLSSA
jgi:serine phosphatase RsbU (regulator of sigma subunit)/integral membrane sensor domain MASE1